MNGLLGRPVRMLLLGLLAGLAVAPATLSAWTEKGPSWRASLSQEEQIWLDEHPTVTVGNGPDFPPYYGWRADGQAMGPVAEYLTALEKLGGLRFRHRHFDDFDGVLAALQDGSIDLIPALTPTESRKRLFRFTGAYLHAPAVLVTRPRVPPITLPLDLAGLKVAVERGHASEEILRRTRPKAHLLLTDSTEAALAAVARGEADAYLGMATAVTAFQLRHPQEALQIRRPFEGDLSGMAMAVHPTNLPLLGILAKAMAALPPPPLEEAHPLSPPAGFVLSDQEHAWLAAHGPIRAGYDEALYPLSYKAPNGQGEGYALQLFRLLRDMAGLAVDEQGSSWSNILERAQSNALDVLVASPRNLERQEQFLLVGPYLSAPTVVVSRDSQGQIWDLGELGGKRLALLQGHFLGPRIRAAYPEIRQIPVAHQVDALEAIIHGQADIAIGNLHAINSLIQQRYLGKLFIAGHIPDGDNELYLAVHRDLPVLASILQRALDSLSPQQIALARNRWLDTVYRPGITVADMSRTLIPLFLVLAILLAVSALGSRRLRKEVDLRRQAEAGLAQHGRELELANQELEAFAYSAAHDLRAPIRHIAGYARLLEEALELGQSDEARQLAARIGKASARQEALVEGLLGLARAARTPLEAHTVNLSELARETWAQIIAQEPANQAIQFRCEPGIMIHGDPALLACLLTNLLSNAAKFCRHRTDPRVTLGPPQPPEPNCFEVRDNGIGILASEAHRLFQPFTRLSSARGTEGSGIGLATARRIAERHGGTIESRPQAQGGACFRVCLAAPPREAPPPAESSH